MQQGMKLPETKENKSVLPLMTITANPMIARVKGDLEDKSGVKIKDYATVLGDKMDKFKEAKTLSEKRDILKDIVKMLEADLAKMREARKDSDIRAKEKDPKYKEAMNKYLSDVEESIQGFKQAIKVTESETMGSAPKKA